VVAIVLMVGIAAICTGALVQSAMALASGQDCSGPGCDQIACGQPLQPQATSGPSASVSLVAVTVPVAAAMIEAHGTMTAPPTLSSPASRPFGPSAPRSPPSA
jgi:hypothetical protein